MNLLCTLYPVQTSTRPINLLMIRCLVLMPADAQIHHVKEHPFFFPDYIDPLTGNTPTG